MKEVFFVSTQNECMLYLFWSLLNIGLFLFFIIVCFRATKLIKGNLGIFAAIIFVFGLLSFIGNPVKDDGNYENESSHQIKQWKFLPIGQASTIPDRGFQLVLEKSYIATYLLGISYGYDKESNKDIPISAYSVTTGLISGINWNPQIIDVDTTETSGRFTYSVNGLMKWKLLGGTIYSQPKSYSGFTNLQ